jgi:hypothetical protein
MKKSLTLDNAIGKLQKHLRKRFPDLQLEIVQDSERTATIWFQAQEDEDWFAVIEHAGPVATDILVDYGYWIHVQPRVKEPAQ